MTTANTKPSYVYVTYIAITPEKAWKAITETDLMRHWWVDPSAGCSRVNVSDWKPGSKWEHTRADGSNIVDIVGKVIENTPPRRLAFSWARPAEEADASKHSSVAFDIEPYSEGLIRLTVSHSGLENDPQMLEGISGGWPKVLSNLKTFLETGSALPHTAAH